MPIPFIAAAAIAATAVTGIGAGAKALKDTKEAKDTNSRAVFIVKDAENTLNLKRIDTNELLSNLGEEKIAILAGPVRDFVSYFRLIKNIELELDSEGIEELSESENSTDLLNDLEAKSVFAAKIASGGLASLGAGAAAAYGAYAGTMFLGTASTGAAISGLTGVAATNATLAWLGGGALTAGGYGMAGGTLVLGGLVAGPALAVGGILLSAQAKKKLNNAYSNLDEARVIAKQMDGVAIGLKAINKRTAAFHELLEEAQVLFVDCIAKMKDVISESGTNWIYYTRDEKEIVHQTVLVAQLIKGIIDTPLLDEDGALTVASKKLIDTGYDRLNEIIEAKQYS